MFFDPVYWLVIGVGMALSLWAQARVKGTFAKYSRMSTQSRMTGADVARGILAQNGIPNTVEQQLAALNELGGLDALGSPKVDNMYHAGWAWADDFPACCFFGELRVVPLCGRPQLVAFVVVGRSVADGRGPGGDQSFPLLRGGSVHHTGRI